MAPTARGRGGGSFLDILRFFLFGIESVYNFAFAPFFFKPPTVLSCLRVSCLCACVMFLFHIVCVSSFLLLITVVFVGRKMSPSTSSKRQIIHMTSIFILARRKKTESIKQGVHVGTRGETKTTSPLLPAKLWLVKLAR